MSKEQSSNHNAKKQVVGFEYQYYIAVDFLLKLNNWDKCLIEENGDVTFLDDNNNQILNIEVKHHINENELKLHSEEFQKTIYNWFKDRDKYTENTKLLLITTSKIDNNNPLFKWNSSSKNEKYNIINKNKHKENDEIYTFIKKYFEEIKEGNFEKLKSLFEKIEIKDSYPKYPEIIELIKTRNALKIFRNRRDKDEKVLNKVISNLHSLITKSLKIDRRWEITHDGFIELLREQTEYIRGIDDFQFQELLKNSYKEKKDFQYVGLDIIEIKKEEKEETISLTEPEDIFKHSSKLLIYGKAGVGKTTFCEYLSWQWGKNEKSIREKFDYIIHVSLRQWKNGGLKGLIKNNFYTQDDEDILLILKENSKKILFLFDGYDELFDEKKSLLRDEITKNNLQYYIITSRPNGYKKDDFKEDVKFFEIKGFNDNGIDSFVDNFFDNIEKKRAIKDFFHQNNNIKNICEVPLLLQMICTLWQKDNYFDKNITITEIYSKIIDNILITHEDENVYFRENRTRIKNILGKLSFESLNNKQVLFSGDLIEELFNYDEIVFFRKGVISTGFIKAIAKNKDILDNDLELSHLTFQEYFSALYVASLSKEEQSEIIRDWKFYPHMQMFFAFLGGLIEDKEFLLKEIKSKPKDIVGRYDLNNLFIFIIQEIKDKDLPEKRLKKINKFFRKEVLNILKYKKLKYFSHLLDKDNLFMLLKMIETDQKEVFTNEVILYILKLSVKNGLDKDNHFFDIVLNIIDKNNDFYDTSEEKDIYNFFADLMRNNKHFSDSLISLMENNIDEKYFISISMLYIITNTVILLGRNNKKIRTIFIKYITNQDIDVSIRTKVLEAFIAIKPTDKKSISALIDFIKDKSLTNILEYFEHQYNAILYLKSLKDIEYSEEDEKIFASYIKEYEEWNQQKIDEIMSQGNINTLPLSETIEEYELYVQSDEGRIYIFLTELSEKGSKYIKNKVNQAFQDDTDIKINTFFYKFIANDDKFISDSIDMLKDKSINPHERKTLGKKFAFFKRTDTKYLNLLLELGKKSNFVDFYKGHDKHYEVNETIEALIYLLFQVFKEKKKDKEFNNWIFTLFSDEYHDSFKESLAGSLYFLNVKDNYFIDSMVKIMTNNPKLKSSIASSLVYLDRCDDKNIEPIVEFIKENYQESDYNDRNNNYFDKLFRLGQKHNKEFYILEKFYFTKEKNKKFFYQFDFTILFKAYDNGSDILDIIYTKAFNNQLPLYIKKNKLYTVENGNEIQTQRKVDKKIFKDIKMLLKRDGLND